MSGSSQERPWNPSPAPRRGIPSVHRLHLAQEHGFQTQRSSEEVSLGLSAPSHPTPEQAPACSTADPSPPPCPAPHQVHLLRGVLWLLVDWLPRSEVCGGPASSSGPFQCRHPDPSWQLRGTQWNGEGEKGGFHSTKMKVTLTRNSVHQHPQNTCLLPCSLELGQM